MSYLVCSHCNSEQFYVYHGDMHYHRTRLLESGLPDDFAWEDVDNDEPPVLEIFFICYNCTMSPVMGKPAL